MTYIFFREPDVMLLVMLLRMLELVSLRRSGTFCGNKIRGLVLNSLLFTGLTTLTAAVRGRNIIISVDIIRWES